MTEETTTAPETAAAEAPAEPKFAVQRIYLKDLSFETPQGAEAFQKQWKPKVNQDLNTKSTKIEEGVYEVALRLTITVSDGEETIYLVEVEQAGLFTISGFPDQQLTQVSKHHLPSDAVPLCPRSCRQYADQGFFPATDDSTD